MICHIQWLFSGSMYSLFWNISLGEARFLLLWFSSTEFLEIIYLSSDPWTISPFFIHWYVTALYPAWSFRSYCFRCDKLFLEKFIWKWSIESCQGNSKHHPHFSLSSSKRFVLGKWYLQIPPRFRDKRSCNSDLYLFKVMELYGFVLLPIPIALSMVAR